MKHAPTLTKAVYKDDLKEVKRLLKIGKNINKSTKKHYPAMYYAHSLDMMKLLLRYKADIRCTDEDGGEVNLFIHGLVGKCRVFKDKCGAITSFIDVAKYTKKYSLKLTKKEVEHHVDSMFKVKSFCVENNERSSLLTYLIPGVLYFVTEKGFKLPNLINFMFHQLVGGCSTPAYIDCLLEVVGVEEFMRRIRELPFNKQTCPYYEYGPELPPEDSLRDIVRHLLSKGIKPHGLDYDGLLIDTKYDITSFKDFFQLLLDNRVRFKFTLGYVNTSNLVKSMRRNIVNKKGIVNYIKTVVLKIQSTLVMSPLFILHKEEHFLMIRDELFKAHQEKFDRCLSIIEYHPLRGNYVAKVVEEYWPDEKE